MNSASIAVLVSVFLALASAILGAKYSQGKSKAKQLTQLLNEIIDAAEDDAVSDEEFQRIVASAKQVVSA